MAWLFDVIVAASCDRVGN